jgi:hypothetical protein
MNCQFCDQDDPTSFLLYHLPANVLLPHLFHILIVGLATSETVSGYEACTFRQTAILCALVLVSLDIFLTVTYAPIISPGTIAPAGTFWMAGTIRPLALMVFDMAVAFLIYASATGRFYLLPGLSAAGANDPELSRRRTEELLTQTNLSLQMAATNLRAYSIARNAVVRDPALKGADDEYWRTVVRMEGDAIGAGGDGMDDDLWADEEVQAAIASAYGSGTVRIENIRRDAESFVKHATRDLDGR